MTNNLSPIFVGVDSGGTKTKVVLFDENLKMISEDVLGPGNIFQTGEDKFASLLEQIIDIIGKDNITRSFITFGIPGYFDSNETNKVIDEYVAKYFSSSNYYVYNDINIAAFGALDFNDGIVVVSGTGSIAIKQNDNKVIGGWGDLFGDDGSSYYIGRKTLNAFTKQADEIIPKTELYEIIIKNYGLSSPNEIIDIVYNGANKRTTIAKFAVECAKAAEKGCPQCKEILDNAVEELILLVNTLANGNTCEIVSYIGGTFYNEYILNEFKMNLENQGFKVITPIYSAEYGAVLNSYRKYKTQNGGNNDNT